MSGAGGSTSGAGGSVSAGSGGSAGAAAGDCADPVETAPGSGTFRCDDGLVHRQTPGTCAAYVPTTEIHDDSRRPEEDTCHTDSDCTERSLGECEPGALTFFGNPHIQNLCVYHCTSDADCDDGFVCECADDRGTCRESNCAADADCGEGYCALHPPGCGVPGFACQTPEDECRVAADCGGTTYDCTSFDGGPWQCTIGGCPG